MGHSARASADAGGPTDDAAAQSAQSAPIWNAPLSAPVSGCAVRNGKPIPFTLETGAVAPEAYRLLPEQIFMAGLVLISFFAPIFRLLG